jgi:uncharacterized repeat protein (TIGR01451 family)
MSSKRSASNFSLFESLEDRVLFDGVPDATFILPQPDSAELVPAQVQSIHQADVATKELILVDASVEDSEVLLEEVLQNRPNSAFEVRMINADENGVAQISGILAESDGKYDAIHIISHGDEGEVNLGNSKLTTENLGQYASDLAGWADALTDGADLLFYGCELAGNEAGESFINSISAITGADVAASNDVTGSSDQNGDWDLEFTSGLVLTEVLTSATYTGTLALADATLAIVSDGTPTWDGDNNPGNDTDGANGIIRSHDIIAMEVFYNTDSGGATDLNFTSTLPDGLVWNTLPAAAALDSRSMIVDSVTGLAGGDMRSIIAYLPDVAGTFTSSVVFEARALGGEHDTELNGVEFDVNATENTSAISTEAFDFRLSSAANMDIELLAPTFRGVHLDATGSQQGVVYSYGIAIRGDHPTRTGTDAVKGSAPIEDNFTFDIDLSAVTPNSTIFSWGPSLGVNTEAATDGINRNYERYTTSTGGTSTAWSNSGRPAGQTDEAGSAVWSAERSTPDSGDWTIAGSAGAVHSVQVSGADTTGSHFPDRKAGGGVIPAAEKWFTSSMVHVWIPIDEILPGEDGVDGTADDGVLDIMPVITNFDPDDYWGVTNNFGSGIDETEDISNNDYEHTVFAFNLGGSTKYNSEAGHATSGRWVDTSSSWSAGDGETSVEHTYDARVSSGRNQGVLALEGIVFGDKFDNTATKVTANSLPSESTDGWSRVYISGGPNTGNFAVEGVDYIIEFGTGGVGGAAGGWTDWNSMGDATLADGETSTVWSQDPTDAALGGTAYADGVRDSITKWRVTMLRDLEPGETLISLVTMETVGHSTLDLANNPGGNIIANFNAQSVGYLRDNPNPDDDWRGSEYDPLNNNWYPEGTSGHLNRGDRLWIVDANVDVDKSIVDLGAGNNYLAGSAATVQLEATVTIPGPDTGSPAQDVYVTDMLPAGLTVVGGSAQPAAGYTFTAGDGSTISVQAVEYYHPTTSSWSNTWTYGATGIRWYYGDVPLNTALPTMTFDVLIPFDAMNGESWTNTAVASSPSDDTTEEFRSSSAGLVAVQVAAMSAGKFVVTPLVPEDTTIIYELGVANVSDDKDVPWFDLVDILPYDADFEGSSINGVYTDIDVNGLDPGLEVYVTTVAATTLDAVDGTVDGYADPGTAAAGDAWFVAEGTGIWSYTLADVQSGAAGAPTMGDITAIRVVSDKTIDPYLAPGESTKFFLELTPDGNVGIPSDHYTNKLTARTDPGGLPLPVTSAAVTAVVVAPDIEIEKEVALDETHVNIDGTNDAHWGETVSFDDTDKAYFRLKVTNTGTADFLGATVTDNLPAGATFVSGTAAASTGDFSGFPATWTFDLAAGDTAYLIYQLDVNDAGNYVNSADVEATDQWGETVDDTDDAEANFVTEISAAKQQTNAVRSTVNPDFFEVTYEVEVMNTSIFDLAQITLNEDLVGAFGAGFQGMVTPPAVTSSSVSAGGTAPTINGSFNGSGDTAILNADGLLLPTDSITITYTVNVDPLLLPDAANTVNQVEAGGVTGGPGGTPTTDLSDDGSDPNSDNAGSRGDTGGTDDPTPLALPSIDLTKEIVGSPVPASSGVNGNFDVTYEFMLTNTGTTDLDNISLTEDFLANLGGAFKGIVSGPTVTMTSATDNPDWNFDYDGGVTDSNVFNNLPTTDTFTYGGSTSNTSIDRTLYVGDQQIVIDPNQVYDLSVDAYAGDGAGGNYDPAAGHYLGFISYDIDGNVVNPYSYAKFAGSTDTTLAAALNPGDTTITLTDASGWSNAGGNHTRTIAWYGYTDSTGFTYPDYDYTRNYLANAWDPGAVSGNTITLSSPWAGPALAAGDAVRNSTSGGSYQYVLLSAGNVPQTSTNFATQIGGGFISNGTLGTTQFRPGTHSISSLVLADWLSGGTNTQLNVDNFELTAPNTSLMEPGQKVTFQITVEIDPDDPGAIYDGITGDGDNSLENQASVTAQDPWNDQPVADTSDDPTDPTDAEYGDDSDPDDPTSLLFPNIELTKAIVGTPVAASSGTFGNMDVTFEFEITNSGNEPLENISLMENLLAQYGGAFQGIVPQGPTMAPAIVTFTDATNGVEINANFDGGNSDSELIDNTSGTNELEMGQTIRIQFIVEVDPDNATALYTSGMLVNQASVTGVGTTSGVLTDDESDDPNDSTDNDGDADNDPDDPTTWQVPVIDLTKTLVGDPVAASSGNQGNFDVTYDFTITNFGNAPMDMLSLQEDVRAQYGTAFIAIVSQGGVPATIQSSSMTDAPEINSSYDGGILDAEVFDNSGGNINLIEMGQSVTIRIIFEVDPNAVGANLDANNNLVNQATVSGNHDGTTYTDNSDDPNNSDDVDPNDDNNPDDPNRLFIADISLAKEVVGTPAALPNGNFEVTYQIVVENTGNASLDISLEDDLESQFGDAFVSAGSLTMINQPADNPITLDSANWDGDMVTEMVNQTQTNILDAGEFFIVQITVEVDPDASGTSGMLNNQAMVSGDAVDENGLPLSDSNGDPVVVDDLSDTGSDPETDNPGEDGDLGTSDDPTPLLLPDVRVAKQANSVTQVPGLSSVFDVEYIVVIENTGTIELTDLQITDDITLLTNFGDAYTPTFIGTGSLDRTGLVELPTLVSHTLANASDLPNFDSGFLGGAGQTGVFDGTSGALQVGEQIMVTYTVRIDGAELLNGPDGTTAPTPGNQVQGSADSASGMVDDDSDDGLNPNTDNGEGTTDDPTPFEVPQVRLWKEHSDAVSNGDGTSTITVTLRVENTGTVDLTNLTLEEDLGDQFGAAYVSATVPTIDSTLAPTSTIPANLINSNWTGDTSLDMFDTNVTSELLVSGEEFTVTFDVIVDPDKLDDDADYLTNTSTVTADGQNFDGSTIAVDDQSGSDTGDGFDRDEPTEAIVPEIGIAKSAGDAVANGENFDVTFTLVVENTGSINLDMLTLYDDIRSEFGNAYAGVSGLAVQNFVGSGTAPTANTAWESDTALNMLNMDGNLDPGDRFEVVFTATIDPDGLDSISQGLTNQATVGGRGVDEMGNVLTDDSGGPLMAEDDSDSGTSPQGNNTDENGDTGTSDDPTPIVIADISAVKQIVGTPTLLANGNFEVTYQVVIENTGTVNLANLTLDEDLANQFGMAYEDAYGLALTTPPIATTSTVTLDTANWNGGTNTEIVNTAVPSLLTVGDSFIFEFKVEVDAAMATGVLENTVTAGGSAVDSNGNPYLDSTLTPITATDDSDSGTDPSTDNPGEPGDTGSTDDPTPLLIANIGLAKEAGDAVANGDNWDVEFTLVWENTGTVALDAVELFDNIASQFGNQFEGIVPGSLVVQNFVGTGTVPTANSAWETDTTQSLITSAGFLEVGDTFEVVFTVTIDPDVSGTSSSGLQNQATTNGTGVNPDTGLADPTLPAEDTSDDGTSPTTENDDDNGDGTFGNDPTPVIIADIAVVKSVVGTPVALDNGNFEVTYELVIENNGNVNLANLSLLENLSASFGTALIGAGNLTLVTPPADVASLVEIDDNWNGNGVTEMIDQAVATLLAVGDSYVVQFTVEVDPDAIGAPTNLDNQVTTGGDAVDENNQPILGSDGVTPLVASDDSDTGSDPNGDNLGEQGDTGGSNDPTPLLIPDISIAKSAGEAIQIGDDWRVFFRLFVENTGNVTLDNLTLFDDVASQFGNAFVDAGNLSIANFNGTGTAPGANLAWTGDTSANILDGTGSLDVGDSFQVVFYVDIDPDGIDGVSQGLENQAVVGGDGVNPDGTPMLDDSDNPVQASDDSDNGTDTASENGEDDGDGIAENDPTPIRIADLSIAKSIAGEPVLTDLANYVVTYQVVIENTGTLDLASLSLLENVASQFGSAFVDAGNLTLLSGPSDPASSIAVNSAGWNGNLVSEMMDTAASNVLATGDSFTIAFDVEINPAEVSAPLENQVEGTGEATDANGDPLIASDVSDSGTETGSSNPDASDDQGTPDDPTLFDPPPVPLSGITGTVFQDDNGDGIQQLGEAGIPGVEMTLTGTDVFGNPVEITVVTDENGQYTFEDLNAGDYQISQVQPDGYDDGLVFGESNINLGWGDNIGDSTFAELLPGASGNPPRLPGLPPISVSPISNLLSSFLGGPGPIYSGVPINANANPLTLDSGRAVNGGYSGGTAGIGEGDCGCGCPAPINPCCQPGVVGMPSEQMTQNQQGDIPPEAMIMDQGLLQGEVVEEVYQEALPAEVPVDQNCQPVIDPAMDCLRKPGFLKRFANWMGR